MGIFRFIFSKYFLINVVIYLVLIAIALWGVLYSLDKYTLHGETLTMPDFKGYHTSELNNFLKDKEFRYEIVDSVYDDNAAKGVVIEQNPKPGVQVKRGRKIYFTINANSTKKIKFPNLVDVTLRQANAILETYGIKVDSLKYKPDPCVNCVLQVLMDATSIEPGTMFPVKESVVLVLGGGLSDEYIAVPILINLGLAEAELELKRLGLNLGAYTYEDCETMEDTLGAKVYKQIPDYQKNKIQLGQSINIFLTGDTTRIPEIVVDSTLNIEEFVN